MDREIDIKNSKVFGNLLKDVQYVTNNINELGVEGYFSNTPGFSDYTLGSLDSIKSIYYTRLDTRSREPYCADGIGSFSYFIPKSQCKFKDKEGKKLRPFNSMREFFDVTGFDIGDIIDVKKVIGYEYEETTIFNGYRVEANNTYIIFGNHAHDFDELMEFYRYKDDKWLPFGIEE